MARLIVVSITVALAAGATACGAPDSEQENTTDSLIGGTPTSARPEIGFVSLTDHGSCTATLVAPDAVLTAAHCVDFGSKTEVGDYGWLGLDTASGRKAYTIDRYVSLGRDLGARDLAVMHLATPVDTGAARPTTIASTAPARGSAVVIYGYGCLERQRQSGTFEKRSAPATYEDSKRLCPGDSGGPATQGADGPIVSINSGYYVEAGDDIFADPVANQAAIAAQLAAWGPAPASERVSITNATGGPLWTRCDGAEGPGCSGWVFIAAGSRGAADTFRRRLILENQAYVPGFRLANRAIVAPSLDVTIHANESDPLSAKAESADPCLGGRDSATAAPAPFDGDGAICADRDTWFAITTDAGATIEVDATFAHGDGDVDLALFDPTGAQVAKSDTTTDAESIRFTTTAVGTHWIRAYGYRGAANDIHLRIAAR